MSKPTLTIRMGAANWDATVIHQGRPINFNFRTMTRDQRRQWYGTFMSSVRKNLRKGRR